MTISVAMCTYNGRRFLEAQLRSIAAQTRLPSELVICDDGSTDTTPDIVQLFSETVSFPVRFTRNPENLGSTKNFEKAISLCQCELIALCDQDDVWMPEKLERLAGILEREPETAGVFSDARLIDDSGVPAGGTLWGRVGFSRQDKRRFHADQAYFLVRRPLVTGATMMFRASSMSDILPISPEWVHDEWIALVLAAVSRIKPVNEVLISYRLHAAQQIGVRKVPRHVALQAGRQERVAFFRSLGCKLSAIADKLTGLAGNHKSARYARTKAAYMNTRASLLAANRGLRILRGVAILPGHIRFASGPVSYLRDLLHT